MNFSEEEKYLQPGPQTEITSKIKEISSSFDGGFDNDIQSAFRYVKALERNETNKRDLFRKRTADQIIRDGFVTGCTDEGLVFIVLVRAAGIPAKYIETIKNEGLTDAANNNGHIFVGVYDKFRKIWETVDPSLQKNGIDPARFGFTVVDEGLDSWDIGITDFYSLKEKFSDFRKLVAGSPREI